MNTDRSCHKEHLLRFLRNSQETFTQLSSNHIDRSPSDTHLPNRARNQLAPQAAPTTALHPANPAHRSTPLHRPRPPLIQPHQSAARTGSWETKVLDSQAQTPAHVDSVKRRKRSEARELKQVLPNSQSIQWEVILCARGKPIYV